MATDKLVKKYSPGERIIAEGERGSRVYILLNGELAVWRGRTELARLKGHGDVVGELAALTGRPRAASVVAATPSELLEIDLNARVLFKARPEVMDKIDHAITMRFEIARNKSKLYVDNTSLARRALLQDVIVERDLAASPKLKDMEPSVRKKIRRLIEESFDLHGDQDDPRVIRKIADENGVVDRYSTALTTRPWLDEGLVVRFHDLEDRFRLTTQIDLISAMKDRAGITMEMLDLLGEYESLPGMTKEMDILHMEKVVPFGVKTDLFRALCMKEFREKFPHAGENDLRYWERRVIAMIEKQKINAGKDLVMLVRAAEELGIAAAYFAELKRVLEISESSSSYVELPAL